MLAERLSYWNHVEGGNKTNTIIIRTAWLFSPYGKNFVKTIYEKLSRGAFDAKVVDDQIGCPTYAPQLAEFICDLIDKRIFTPKVYHACGNSPMSWYGLARLVGEAIGKKHRVFATESEPNAAVQRPRFSVLDNTMLINQLNTNGKSPLELLKGFVVECVEAFRKS